MTSRHLVSLTALSFGVALAAAAPAFAGPPGHPFERKPVPATPAPNTAPQAQAANCDCMMMMKDGAAMRDQCMAMMSGHPQPSQPGAAG